MKNELHSIEEEVTFRVIDLYISYGYLIWHIDTLLELDRSFEWRLSEAHASDLSLDKSGLWNRLLYLVLDNQLCLVEDITAVRSLQTRPDVVVYLHVWLLSHLIILVVQS